MVTKQNDSADSLSKTRREFAIDVVRRLTDAGFNALWAGGCVRDYLLGNAPIDYDVATSAHPEQVRELFGYRRTIPVGASFGVIVVLGPSKEHGQVEVATFRTDSSYSDGRHPDHVTYSTPEEDAQRRDFTINGMFFDPQRQETIDFVGGQEDLKKRLIRAIGVPEHRIAEDKLRMLRAIRFAARFEFEIEAHTYEAISRHAPEIAVVSAERIAAELRKTLITHRAAWAVDCLAETKLLKHVLPTVAQAWPSIAVEAKKILAEIENQVWMVAFSALHWPIVKHEEVAQIKQILAGVQSLLRLANDESDAAFFILSSQKTLEQAHTLRWSRVQPLLAHRHAPLAIALLEARCRAGMLDDRVSAWLQEKLQLAPELLNPAAIVSGRELIQLGLRPGPEFSRLLQQIRDRQLDGQFDNTEAALQWLKSQP